MSLSSYKGPVTDAEVLALLVCGQAERTDDGTEYPDFLLTVDVPLRTLALLCKDLALGVLAPLTDLGPGLDTSPIRSYAVM